MAEGDVQFWACARGGIGRRARLRAWFPFQGVLVRVQSSAPVLISGVDTPKRLVLTAADFCMKCPWHILASWELSWQYSE